MFLTVTICFVCTYTQINQDCNFIKSLKILCKHEKSVGKATIYTLIPEKKTLLAEGVFECYIETPAQKKSVQDEKVLLLLGATGKGKSTLINRMVNHIFGVEYTDDFRFKLVDEKGSGQIVSQTKGIFKYTICNSKLKFVLSVIDTPGFGDTSGRQDVQLIYRLKDLFSSGTIVSIDAICFVTNYNQQRITQFERYIFESIITIFGKDVGVNIFVMTSFCDDVYDENEEIRQSVVLEQLCKLRIPFYKSFPFNNYQIYNEPASQKSKKFQIYLEQWKTSTISCSLFFDELEKTVPVSLVLTKEILQRQYDIIYIKLPQFVRKLQQSIQIKILLLL